VGGGGGGGGTEGREPFSKEGSGRLDASRAVHKGTRVSFRTVNINTQYSVVHCDAHGDAAACTVPLGVPLPPSDGAVPGSSAARSAFGGPCTAPAVKAPVTAPAP
jgi:hypothetical protein